MKTVLKQRLGTTEHGGYVVVEVDFREQKGTWGTVTHGPEVTDPRELSIMGDQYEKGDRRDNPSRCGQIVDALDEITEPASGWTLAEIRELRQIWDRWHLNGARAGCVHMPPSEDLIREPSDHGYDRISTTANVCPETGYRWGTAWLVEPLPESVEERVKYLMRDRSADLYKARGYDAQGRAVE